MRTLLVAAVLMLASNAFAQKKLYPTEGQELHFTCVMNFTPFFIELNSNHQTGKIYLNYRYDEQGRGHSREFITNIRLSSRKETFTHKLMTFASASRENHFKSLYLEIPKFIDLYLGMPDQPARIDLKDESHLPGTCYVQFPAMAPQW
jgi:hypothetical protein